MVSPFATSKEISLRTGFPFLYSKLTSSNVILSLNSGKLTASFLSLIPGFLSNLDTTLSIAQRQVVIFFALLPKPFIGVYNIINAVINETN